MKRGKKKRRDKNKQKKRGKKKKKKKTLGSQKFGQRLVLLMFVL
jgi:hypothetical protein